MVQQGRGEVLEEVRVAELRVLSLVAICTGGVFGFWGAKWGDAVSMVLGLGVFLCGTALLMKSCGVPGVFKFLGLNQKSRGE